MADKTCIECASPSVNKMNCCEESGMVSCRTPHSFLGGFVKNIPFVGNLLSSVIEFIPFIGGGNKLIVNPIALTADLINAPDDDAACKVIDPNFFAV